MLLKSIISFHVDSVHMQFLSISVGIYEIIIFNWNFVPIEINGVCYSIINENEFSLVHICKFWAILK